MARIGWCAVRSMPTRRRVWWCRRKRIFGIAWGACQVGGSVIDWVMRLEGVSFRRAVEMLKREIGEGPAVGLSVAAGTPTKVAGIASPIPSLAADPGLGSASLLDGAGDDQALLDRVINYYHATLKASPEALAYL